MKVQNHKTQTMELVERTGPEIFRFESPGDCLRGQLLNIETADIGGKPTLRYIVREEEPQGRILSFLGTVDLNTKIRSSDVGKILEVQYLGKDPETDAGKNPIKRFKVFVEKQK
jgi:hypothetical protein